MKITLKSFRCYDNDTFDFGTNGLVLLSGRSGSGKCMAKDTPILMYDGSIKNIQDIKDGELLMGDDSTPRTVLSTCEGEDTMYRIVPTKGRPYAVNSKHILTLKGAQPHMGYQKSLSIWVVTYMENCRRKSKQFQEEKQANEFFESLPTEPVFDICIQDYLRLNKSNQRFNYTYHVGTDFEHKDIPLDPYLIGVWLGDGKSKESSINSVDGEILDCLEVLLKRHDLMLKKNQITYRIVNSPQSTANIRSAKNSSGKQGVCFQNGYWKCNWKENGKFKSKYFSLKKYGESAKEMAFQYMDNKLIVTKHRINFFTDTLKELNLWGNKHIPYIYKTNSRSNRLKLLAGLIDTDGHVSKNTIKITKKRKKLARDIEYLALSLGFMATFKEVQKSYKYKGETKTGIYYSVCIFGSNLDEIPTVLSRKMLKSRDKTKRVTVLGFKVEQIGKGQYYGFELDGNGRYLLGDFTVTHNTSIVLGIYFALFGTGTKLVSYGKTTCKVVLEFDDLTITRTKRPNRLVVQDNCGNTYEDAPAQSILDEKFGNSFRTTGYISQNARDSFIMLSPIEKLAFLENFAFHDINLVQIKKRCKDLIRERSETLLKTTSQLELATSMIKELKLPEKVKFPLKCSKKNMIKVINNENIRYKNTMVLIKKCTQKIEAIKIEQKSLQILKAKIQCKQDSLDTVIEKIADLTIEEGSVVYMGDETVQHYEKQLATIISQREIVILQERYDEDVKRLENMQEAELKSLTEQLENINDGLWKEYKEEEVIQTIIEYKQIIKDLETHQDCMRDLERYQVDESILYEHTKELRSLQVILEEKKKLLDKLRMQQEVFQCPSCDIKLRFQDDDLEIFSNNIEIGIHEQEDIDCVSEDIDKMRRRISTLESSVKIKQNKLQRYQEIKQKIQNIEDLYEDLPTLQDMKRDLEYMRKYNTSQQELSRHVDKLKKQITEKTYSSTVISFQKSLKNQRKRMKELEKELSAGPTGAGSIDEEKIREDIVTQKKNKEKLSSIRQRIHTLTIEKDNYEYQINTCQENHIKTYKKIRELQKVEKRLNESIIELETLENKKIVYENNTKKIDKYQEYLKEKTVYDSWSDKVKLLQKEEVERRKQYGSATMLNEKILEAESIAMINIISSINAHARPYLDEFFPVNPISVQLVPFKETKKKTRKPQITLQIEYKGMEADVNMLSGGEFSRVVLSFSLALGEMFNTPIMLLDECTSSLDQELTADIVESIRDNLSGKLIIMICHQICTGQFDRVIELK